MRAHGRCVAKKWAVIATVFLAAVVPAGVSNAASAGNVATAAAPAVDVAPPVEPRPAETPPGPAAPEVVSRDATPSLPATPTIRWPASGTKTKYYSTTIKVAISKDTTRVLIRRGTTQVTSRAVSRDTSVTFSGVGLRLGTNTLRAVAVNAAGRVVSAPVRVRVIGRVGKLGFYGFFRYRVYNHRRPAISGRTGPNTSSLRLYVNGRRIRTVRVKARSRFALRQVPLRYGANRVTIYSRNEFYRRRVTKVVWRLDVRPAFRTVVLVDKSEKHIYYIRGRKLIYRFLCAIGKPSTPTPERVWRVDSKEYTDPSSAYGPRKLRLFARHGSGNGYSYEYTNYGIHGTDTPSSIGHMASHGCVRLWNFNILKLFRAVRLHTMVITRA